MRELNMEEIEAVDGGYISGYQGANAILLVTAIGLAMGPVGGAVLGFAFGSAGGLAIAQFISDIAH